IICTNKSFFFYCTNILYKQEKRKIEKDCFYADDKFSHYRHPVLIVISIYTTIKAYKQGTKFPIFLYRNYNYMLQFTSSFHPLSTLFYAKGHKESNVLPKLTPTLCLRFYKDSFNYIFQKYLIFIFVGGNYYEKV
ncbi:MAG: hypothetical protein IJY79_02700, partial [Clostridia bacterium]|nr:hypothetical protein [Clostridia bacterium]